TMGARLVEGRAFKPSDGADAPAVLIVNESFARRYLAPGRRVGRELRIFAGNIGPLGGNLKYDREAGHREHGARFEVIGVVADVRNAPLRQPVEPAIFFSTRQFPFGELKLAVQADHPAIAVEAVRAAVHEVSPNTPVGEAKTWGERFAEQTGEPRLLMSTLVFFGFLASLLAAIGVYGIFSWSVAMRTRELAIRLALGAEPLNVGRLVVGQTAALVAVGVLVGVVLVQVAGATIARVLFEVSPHAAAPTLGAMLVLAAAAIFASLAPARRAMRVDPVVGLRAE